MTIQKGFFIFCCTLSIVLLLQTLRVASGALHSPSKEENQRVVVSDLSVIEPNHESLAIMKEQPTSTPAARGVLQKVQTWFQTIIPAGGDEFHPQAHTTVDYPPFALPLSLIHI